MDGPTIALTIFGKSEILSTGKDESSIWWNTADIALYANPFQRRATPVG
jgi:hypothetical protein